MRKMRILLPDGHRKLSELDRGLLEPTFAVVGCVEDGDTLVEAAGELHPDIIVTDISVPKLDQTEAANRLRESGSSSRIAFLKAHVDPDFVQAALKTGALAYVSKLRIGADFLVANRRDPRGAHFCLPIGISYITGKAGRQSLFLQYSLHSSEGELERNLLPASTTTLPGTIHRSS